MRILIAGALLCVSFAAQGQAVTARWVNATITTAGTPIPASGSGALVRTVVEYGTKTATNGFGTKQGEVWVAAPATSLQLSLVVAQEYALRAFHCNTYATAFVVNAPGCSAFSNVAIVFVQPPTPQTPTGLTVSSTRIESAEWTCRDIAGNILSSHTRQDKAEEACLNRALAALDTPFEVRPSGYRWVAQVR